MRLFNRCASWGTMLLLLGLMAIPLNAQTQSQQQPEMPQSSTAQSAQQVQVFAGKIVQMKNKLVLKDASSKATYKLDNEAQAKPYVGKNVKVTGTFDPATKTIYASDIEIVGSSSY
jgi:hypothetical protein